MSPHDIKILQEIIDREDKVVTNKEDLLKEACEILNSLRIDAEMALCGNWDKSDEGFETQINFIDDFFFKIDYRPEVYEPEDEEKADWKEYVNS